MTQYPQVYAKVKEEVDQFYGDGINVTIENIQKMDYLMATIKESLRVFSPAVSNFQRVATQDHMLGNIKVKKGTYATADLTARNFDPRVFKDPEEFRPERFLKNDPMHSFQFIPFSAGSHNCIGQHFA